jgi:hypothetical protein
MTPQEALEIATKGSRFDGRIGPDDPHFQAGLREVARRRARGE